MRTATRTERLLVSRQDPTTRLFTRVGELSRAGDGYVFTYDNGITRALPGLPLGRDHRSTNLFPVFAERILSPSRPDRRMTLAQLDLDAGAEPFEVLARSGGRRTGDTYELTPIPEPGPVSLLFLVHGVSHLPKTGQECVDSLRAGDALELVREPGNPVNPQAIQVTRMGMPIGYVPDPLIDIVARVLGADHGPRLSVARVNPRDAGFHMRILVAMDGYLPELGTT